VRGIEAGRRRRRKPWSCFLPAALALTVEVWISWQEEEEITILWLVAE